MSEVRLIDANALPRVKQWFECGQYIGEETEERELVRAHEIDSAPTIAPVRVEWIVGDKDEWWCPVHTCPLCKHDCPGGNYCPNCGSKMGGEG